MTSRRFSVRREIAARHFYTWRHDHGGASARVDIILTCGHKRTYPVSNSPRIGATVACSTCAPKEIR